MDGDPALAASAVLLRCVARGAKSSDVRLIWSGAVLSAFEQYPGIAMKSGM